MDPVAAGDGAHDRFAMTSRGPSPLKAALILALLASVAFAVVLLAGPGSPTNLVAPPIYDGWQAGTLDNCPRLGPYHDPAKPPSASVCAASLAVWLTAARDAFDRRDPTHAPVVRATLHFMPISKFTTDCCEVAVFELGDGTVRAIGVWHPLVTLSNGSPDTDYSRVVTMDYGPDK